MTVLEFGPSVGRVSTVVDSVTGFPPGTTGALPVDEPPDEPPGDEELPGEADAPSLGLGLAPGVSPPEDALGSSGTATPSGPITVVSPWEVV